MPPRIDETQRENRDSAEALYESGRIAYSRDEYDRALALFRAAQKAWAAQTAPPPPPAKKHAISVAASLYYLGRYDEALEEYESILSIYASDLDDKTKIEINKRISGIKTHIGYLDVSTTPSAEVYVDGRHRGTSPQPAPIPVIAGRRVQVRVHRSGYEDFERGVSVSVGEKRALFAALTHTGPWWLEVHGGPLVGRASGSVEPRCEEPRCLFVGPYVGVRFGHDWPNHVSWQLGAGYLRLMRKSHRDRTGALLLPTRQLPTYHIDDDLRLDVPFVSTGLGYRVRWHRAVGVSLYAHLAAALPVTHDDITAGVSVTRFPGTVKVGPPGGSNLNQGSPAMLVLFGCDLIFPLDEVSFNRTRVPVYVTVGVATILQPLVGLKRNYGDLQAERTPRPCSPAAHVLPPECARGLSLEDRTYGPFSLFVPNIGFAYRF